MRVSAAGVVAILIVCGAPSSLLAALSQAGLWQQTGYRVETDGTRIPCEMGQCVVLPDGGDIDKFCAPADILAPYARNHLEQFATVEKLTGAPCKILDKEAETTWDRELTCNVVTIKQQIIQPDDKHLSYETIVYGMPPGASPVVSRFGASLVWLGSDCTGAGSAIRSLGNSQRQVTPP